VAIGFADNRDNNRGGGMRKLIELIVIASVIISGGVLLVGMLYGMCFGVPYTVKEYADYGQPLSTEMTEWVTINKHGGAI